MKTQTKLSKANTKFALASYTADGLLVRKNGDYVVSTDAYFEDKDYYEQCTILFDSEKEASAWADEKGYYNLYVTSYENFIEIINY